MHFFLYNIFIYLCYNKLMETKFINKIKNRVVFGKVLENEPMKNYLSFKVGGPADLLVMPDDADELIHAVGICKEEGIPYYVIGKGSNVIVRDGGFRGVIIMISPNVSEVRVDGRFVYAEAGVSLADVAKEAADNSLTGMEFAAGIPGSLGGGVFMNAGAYDGDMSGIVESADVFDPEAGRVVTLNKEQLAFGYRTSAIQGTSRIILAAKLKLSQGDKESIKAKMEDFNNRRNDKQPLDLPSAGSTFKRPEGYFAGKLIQDCNLQGTSLGGAKVSEKHAGFVVNTGDARAEDIINLIAIVQAVVLSQKGVSLEREVRIIGED